ncbi:MAG: hypothetical protein WC503_03330 [Candidatus Shapirobacteria bacterium]
MDTDQTSSSTPPLSITASDPIIPLESESTPILTATIIDDPSPDAGQISTEPTPTTPIETSSPVTPSISTEPLVSPVSPISPIIPPTSPAISPSVSTPEPLPQKGSKIIPIGIILLIIFLATYAYITLSGGLTSK